MPTDQPARVVYRYEVPVDDEWHDLELCGPLPPKLVASRYPDTVELWVEGRPDTPVPARLRVFGTGQPIPHGATHQGSCLNETSEVLTRKGIGRVTRGQLVWHLYATAPTRL